MTVSAPPESGNKWLDLLDRANRLNLIPILLAIYLAWMNYTRDNESKKALAESEARTRVALASCTAETTAQAKQTRTVVRETVKAATEGSP